MLSLKNEGAFCLGGYLTGYHRIKLHRNFRNLCFQVSFSQNFQLAASLFYSIIRNFSYFRPKGCCFYPVSCVFLLHMGLLITTYANLVNVWKTSGEAGDQRVKHAITFLLLGIKTYVAKNLGPVVQSLIKAILSLKGQCHGRYHNFWPKFTKFKLCTLC